MELLGARPIGRHIDDGERRVYECQSCYRTYEGIFDPDDNRNTIPCAFGCWDEEEDHQ